MNMLSPFLSLNYSCDDSLVWLKKRLGKARLRVVQTFNLHTARMGVHDCPCPNHGTEECDCQMVIVLVYGDATEPVTLVLHGNNGQTWLSLVNTSAQRVTPSLQESIERALQIHLSQ